MDSIRKRIIARLFELAKGSMAMVNILKSRWFPWLLCVALVIWWSATIGWIMSDGRTMTDSNERTLAAIDDYYDQAIEVQEAENNRLKLVAERAETGAVAAREHERDTLLTLRSERQAHGKTRRKLATVLASQAQRFGEESLIKTGSKADTVEMPSEMAYELAEARERCDGSLSRCRANVASLKLSLSEAAMLATENDRRIGRCEASNSSYKERIDASQGDKKKAVLTGVGIGAGGLAALEAIAAIIAVIIVFK